MHALTFEYDNISNDQHTATNSINQQN